MRLASAEGLSPGANAAAHPAGGSLPSAGRSRRVRETEGAAVAARDAYFAELGAVGNMRRDYAESSGRSLRDAHGARCWREPSLVACATRVRARVCEYGATRRYS